MNCPSCKAQVPGSASSCKSCGAKLNSEPDADDVKHPPVDHNGHRRPGSY